MHNIDRYYSPSLHIDYSTYRQLMGHGGFRKTGLLVPESLERAQADPRTVYILYSDGYQHGVVPLFTPVENEPFYNLGRCEELTNHENVYLMCLPPDVVYQLEIASLVPRNSAIVVERFSKSHPKYNELEKIQIANMFRGEWHDFQDIQPHVKDAIFQNAWMGIFHFAIEPQTEHTPIDSLRESWEQLHSASEELQDDTTMLYSGEQIIQDRALIDTLWGISQNGFGKVLGSNHPISMEVNRDFFESQLNSSGVYVAVKCINAQPVCFASLALDLDHNPWIDMESPQMQGIISTSNNKKEERLAHFFEVISTGENAGHAAGIFTELLAAAGNMGPIRVIFESTNRSAQYIPKIATDCINTSVAVRFRPGAAIQQFGKLDYGWVAT